MGFLSKIWVFSEEGKWVSREFEVWEVERGLWRRENGLEVSGFWVLRWFLMGGERKNKVARDSMRSADNTRMGKRERIKS